MLKIVLCGACAAKMKDAYDVKRTSGGVDNKVSCSQCHKRRYGGTYEITKKKE